MSNKILVAVDAGHGFFTAGRRCSKKFDEEEHREWWLNNRIANYFCMRAQMYDGFNTIRVDDFTGNIDVSLSSRIAKANTNKADFFFSIHHNAGINGGSGGGITAYSYPNSVTSAKYRDELYEACINATKLKGNRATPKTTANYAVLRETNMPAVLIEHGFMDSSTDVPIILTEQFAKDVAFAEADCVANMFNISNSEVSDVKETDWFFDAVKYVTDRGLMSYADNKFRPNAPITRAEIAQILMNMRA